MRLSNDRKKIYVTDERSCLVVEVIDVATRKVINHFVLNTATRRYRFNGGAPAPDDSVLYTTSTEIDKQADRYEIGKPKYTVIDLAQQKIAKTVDIPGGEEALGGGGRGGGGLNCSS